MAEFSRVEASRKGCLRPGLPGGAMFSLPWRWFPPIGAPGGMARLLRVREAAGASYVPGGRESWRQPVGGSRNSNSGQLCSRTRQYGERLVQPRRSMTCLSELYFSASSIEAPRFSNAMAKQRRPAAPRGRTGSRRRPSAGRGPREAGSARWPTPTTPPTSRDVAGPSRGLEARGKTDRFNSERLWRCPWFEWGVGGRKSRQASASFRVPPLAPTRARRLAVLGHPRVRDVPGVLGARRRIAPRPSAALSRCPRLGYPGCRYRPCRRSRAESRRPGRRRRRRATEPP